MRKAYMLYDKETPAFAGPFLRELLKNDFSVKETHTGTFPVFQREDFLVFVPGSWRQEPNEELLCRILAHVTGGGRMLALGEGLWKVDSPELHLLYGARLCRRLPYSQISLRVSGDFLVEGFEIRELWDVPLIFEQSAFGGMEVSVSMNYGGNRYPLIWHRDWFLGHIYCAAFGSSLRIWEVWKPVLEKIIRHAAEGE